MPFYIVTSEVTRIVIWEDVTRIECLASLRREARRAFNLASNRGTEEAWDEYRVARRNFKTELKRSKRKSWRDFCGELDSLSEAARLSKILSCERKGIIGSLQRTNGT